MIVEIIAVGTELLLGQIVNSNVAYIGRRLAEEGFDAHFQVTVGDNLERLTETIAAASQRSDGVILTGGIGPTQDDLTREALCLATGRPMQRNEEYAEAISRRLTAIRGAVSENNLRMADYPEGAEQLPNTNGVALGLAMELDGAVLFAVPGVPTEMMAMVDDEVMPRLRLTTGAPAAMRSRVIKTWGLGESAVAEILDSLFATANPSVAFLVDGPEVAVRITAKADSAERAEAMIDTVEREIRSALGEVVFGRDDETVESILLASIDERGWAMGAAEVATSGLMGARLARAAGSSPLVRGSVVLPGAGSSVDAPALLGLTDRLDPGSEPDAVERARAVAALFGVDVGVWVGPAVAEPGETWATVIVAVHTPEDGRARRLRLLGNLARVAEFASVSALHIARLAVTGAWWAEEADRGSATGREPETMEDAHD